MMVFRGRLRKARKPIQLRLRYVLEKLRVQDVACTFQATIGGIITPGIMTKDVNTTGFRVIRDVLDLCDERRHLKKAV